MQADHQSARTVVAVLLLPALTVAALWIPFGFSLGGLVEEWGFLELFARKGVFYLISEATLPAQQARPLHVLPQAVAFTLDPDSFFYWHIIQAAGLLMKGACAAVIGIYLTGNRALAAFLGLLTLLYPADTMQLNFRSLSINWANALALLASALLISATLIEARAPRLITGVIAAAVLGAALLMYEAVAGLAALPFPLVFAREGKGAIRVVREKPAIFIVWIGAILAWFAFFWSAVRAGSAYQVFVLSQLSIDAVAKQLLPLASSGLYRAFYECWTELARIVLFELSNFAYPLGFIFILLAALLWLTNAEGEPSANTNTNTNKAVAARTVVAGSITFVLGYAPFLTSNAHLLITQRTFLATAIGAALVIFGVVVYLSAVLDRRVVAAASALLIGGCFLGQLYQFDRYNRIYATIYRPLLSAVTPFFAGSADHAYSVLFNDYGYLSGVWDLGLELRSAVGYLLPQIETSHILVCEARSGRLLPRWHGEPERRYCKRTGDGVAVAEDGGTPAELEGAALATLSADGVVSAEGPEGSPTVLPPRAARLFAASKWQPADSMFRRQERADRYECRFEAMWGYALPCRTFGFFDVQPLRAALGSAFAWIGETNAGLFFDIEPAPTSYRLRIEIQAVVSPSPALETSLNGTKLASTWHDATHIEATFSGDLLRPANNALELRTQLDHNLGLSLAVKSVSITPTPQ
jgi:hypothetical protein